MDVFAKNSWTIRGGRVIDPVRKLDRVMDLAVSGGVIAERVDVDDASVLDATGWIVTPGLLDIHVHLREPGGEHKETIATGTAAAVAGGFTTVACMPNTSPPLDSAENLAWVIERARTTGVCRVLPVATITQGRRGAELVDFARLREAGAVAFSDDGDGLNGDAVMLTALERVRAMGGLLIQHCEDRRLAAGGVVHAGPIAERMGLCGQDPRAESAMLERDLELVRQVPARYHAAHISTAESVELVRRAKADGLPVTAEVCPHHLTLCDEHVLDSGGNPNFKMNPPLRSRADLRTCVEGLIDGTIDCLVTDHAPHTSEEKSVGFVKAPFGIVGLETAVGLAHRVLIESGAADWDRLVTLMSLAPARVLGLPTPTLAPGFPADVTLIDPRARWTVNPDQFVSKSGNSPYAGWSMTSRPVATLVGGRLRHLVDDERARLAE